MKDSLDKILSTVERISFTLIALYVAIFLINFSMKVNPGGYGESLLSALSILFALSGMFLLFLVVVNFLTSGFSKQKERD